MRTGTKLYEDDLELQKELEASALAAEKARLGTEAGAVGTNMPGVTRVNFEPEAVTPPAREVIAPKVVQVPGRADEDLEMAYASAQDREAKKRMAFERGARELVAGLTRTQAPDIISQPGDSVAKLLASRKARDARDAQTNALALRGKKFNFEQQAEAQKTAEDKARDARDFAYRQEHDAASLAQRKDDADAARAMAGAQFANTKKNQAGDDLSNLRKEFNQLPDVKTFGEVDASFQKVKGAASDPSAAGDLAAIFAYMKMLDPGSSVREGEFANAQNAGGIDTKIVAAYNNVLNGQRLTSEQRKDFINQAEKLYVVHKGRRDMQAKRYADLARKQGFDAGDVTGDSGGPQMWRFPDGSVHDVAPEDVELARKKGGVPLG